MRINKKGVHTVFLIGIILLSLLSNVVSARFSINDIENKISSGSQTLLEQVFNDSNYVQYLIIQEDFSGVKVENGETWARISVDLKPSSEFEITENMNLNRNSRREFVKKRGEFFEKKINETLKEILDKNIQLSRLSTEGFDVWVNKEGLERVINNTNVERISYLLEKVQPWLGITSLVKSWFFPIFGICLLIFLSILIFFILKKKKFH